MSYAKRVLMGLLVTAGVGGAEIIDRIVAVVGNQVITWSDLRREARLEDFVNRRPASKRPPTVEVNRGVLERLINQRLVALEREQTSLPSVDEEQVKKRLAKIKTGEAKPGDYGLREKDLVDYMRRQLDLEGFVESRFRTGVQVSAQQVEGYYEKTLVPELKRKGIAQPPALEEVRGQIEEIFRQERVNELLDEWLVEQRTRVRIQVMDQDEP